MFANKFEDLPISQRVGDIIRIHRASVGMYKGIKQFTANIFFNSSWAMFAPSVPKGQTKDKEFSPTSFFGKHMNFDSAQVKIVRTLRKWVVQSFKDFRMLSSQFITELGELNEIQKDDKHFDFDLQVKVIQMIKLDNYTSEIRCVDSSN